VDYVPAFVLLIHQAGVDEFENMNGERFEIAIKGLGNLLHAYPLALGYEKENLNPTMIGNTLEMPLHLPSSFSQFHNLIIQHSHIRKNVGMSAWGIRRGQRGVKAKLVCPEDTWVRYPHNKTFSASDSIHYPL